MKCTLFLIVMLIISVNINAQRVDNGSISRGKGIVTSDNLFSSCKGSRPARLGMSTTTDAKTWVVPAETSFLTGPSLHDLYNECNGITPSSFSNVNINQLPITILDSDGEIITGYMISDNYCELYVNGTLIGKDPVPFTPFNACIARFKVKRPYTIAVKLVDWEENSGLGTENNNGNPHHAGDGGFIARFSDGTISDSTWKAQVYYISPIASPDSVITLPNNTRFTNQVARNINCADSCYAIHYPIPDGWTKQTFSDEDWPHAKEYAPSIVGVNWAAWTNFPDLWNNKNFIWSSNLVVDNLVLLRKTIGQTTDISEDQVMPEFTVEIADNTIRIASKNMHEDIRCNVYSILGESLGHSHIPMISNIAPAELTFNPPKGNFIALLVLESKGIPLFFKQCILSQ